MFNLTLPTFIFAPWLPFHKQPLLITKETLRISGLSHRAEFLFPGQESLVKNADSRAPTQTY